MKILLVHNFYQQPGGEDQVFADEASLLEKNGHAVAKFTMGNDAVTAMGKLELARKTIWNRDAQQSLKQAIREIGAEVVHFHNTFPLVSPAAYYAAHEAGAAVVQTLHNYRLLCPSATFFRNGVVCEKCLGKTIPFPGVIHKCYRGSLTASAGVAAMLTFHRFKGTWQNEVDAYIALTEFARQKFVQGGLPADRIAVKPNFVDPDPGVGEGEGADALFVGRLTEEKGVKILLASWNSLFRRLGRKLVIVGDGPMRDEVERASRENIGIIYAGRRSGAEVHAMMGSSPILIFPSTWYEGQPKTIVESLAKGTPVLASRLGSMPEMIEDGRTGMLFEPGDSADLARKAEMLLNDPAARMLMRRAARQEFETRYTARRNHETIITVYQDALHRMTRRPAGSSEAG